MESWPTGVFLQSEVVFFVHDVLFMYYVYLTSPPVKPDEEGRGCIV